MRAAAGSSATKLLAHLFPRDDLITIVLSDRLDERSFLLGGQVHPLFLIPSIVDRRSAASSSSHEKNLAQTERIGQARPHCTNKGPAYRSSPPHGRGPLSASASRYD